MLGGLAAWAERMHWQPVKRCGKIDAHMAMLTMLLRMHGHQWRGSEFRDARKRVIAAGVSGATSTRAASINVLTAIIGEIVDRRLADLALVSEPDMACEDWDAQWLKHILQRQ